MGKKSNISWTDSTFNCWIGCSRVSPGCVHCYAEELMANRYKRVEWGPTGTRMRTSDAYWKQPIQWNKEAKETGVPWYVFCASLADWLEIHPQIQDIWRENLYDTVESTPYLTWLMLTKRPENTYDLVPPRWLYSGFPENVYFGISVEDQERADKRRNVFKSIPAKTKFISYEPAIGPVNWSGYEFADWMIIGGESDKHNARPFDLVWAKDTINWCYDNSIKPYVKQLGSKPMYLGENYRITDYKGEIMEEWPEFLQVKERP